MNGQLFNFSGGSEIDYTVATIDTTSGSNVWVSVDTGRAYLSEDIMGVIAADNGFVVEVGDLVIISFGSFQNNHESYIASGAEDNYRLYGYNQNIGPETTYDQYSSGTSISNIFARAVTTSEFDPDYIAWKWGARFERFSFDVAIRITQSGSFNGFFLKAERNEIQFDFSFKDNKPYFTDTVIAHYARKFLEQGGSL